MIKTILFVALALIPSLGTFSDQLIKKYSIQIQAVGQEGTAPHAGQIIYMDYEGTLTNGTKFDSSYDRGYPLEFSIGVGKVIKCWDEVGIQMEVRTQVKILCPSATAYGNRTVGPIPANSDLIFLMRRVK